MTALAETAGVTGPGFHSIQKPYRMRIGIRT